MWFALKNSSFLTMRNGIDIMGMYSDFEFTTSIFCWGCHILENVVQYFVTTLDSLGVVPELISC